MGKWNCRLYADDFLVATHEEDGIGVEVWESGRLASSVQLSLADAMGVASFIVRIVHGERVPRVWNRAADVPDGVIVKFEYFHVEEAMAVRYGDAWIFGSEDVNRGIVWEPWEEESHSPSDYSPFTEVI